MSNNQLIISNTHIKNDGESRLCLNDLQKAAGGETRHQPYFFMKREATTDLIAALKPDAELDCDA